MDKIIRHNWIIVILLFIISEVLINPLGEFPLNDDWAYSKPIFTFLNSGEITFLEWQTIPGLSLQAAGLLFCKIFGCSFTSLRLVSILATIILIITFNQILKFYELKPKFRFIILLVLLFNPLTLSLANTFMPDIFILMLTLIGFLFMAKIFREFKSYSFILFIVFTLLATLVRQTGIILPLAFAVVYLATHPLKVKHVLIGLLPVLCNIIVLFIYVLYFKKTGNLPVSFNYQFEHIIHVISHPSISLLKSFSYYLVTSTICLGIFLFPITICNIRSHFTMFKNHFSLRIISILYLFIVLLKMTFSENIMPCVGNMIYPSGIGPIILTGFNSQEIINLLLPWQIFWQSLNILGGVSFCCAMISIFNKLLQQKISRSNYLSYMIPLLFILYLFPICLSYANDRYLLFLLPFLLLAYTLSFNFQFKKILFLISIISLMFFSVAGTHDYMNFHRTRWQAGDHLTKDLAVSPANIDGGFEFNAWYLYGSESYNPQHIGRWWWVENDMYIITPTIIQGFTIESKYKCLTWLSHNLEYIYVLKQSTNNAK